MTNNILKLMKTIS